MSDWIAIAALVVALGCGFLGVRSGRRKYLADKHQTQSESYAQGARDMEASLRAQLSQNVTVVAGNDSRHYGSADPSGELDGVWTGLLDRLGIPDLEALSDSPEALNVVRLALAGLVSGDPTEDRIPRLSEGVTDAHHDRMVLSRGADASTRPDELRREGASGPRIFPALSYAPFDDTDD